MHKHRKIQKTTVSNFSQATHIQSKPSEVSATLPAFPPLQSPTTVIMNPATAPAPAVIPLQQALAFDLAQLVDQLKNGPNLRKSINDMTLPSSFRTVQAAFSTTGGVFDFIDEAILHIASESGELVDNPAALKDRIDSLGIMIGNFDTSIHGVVYFMEGCVVIMDILDSKKCLKDENKAALEDVRRLARDVKEEVERLRGKLDEVDTRRENV